MEVDEVLEGIARVKADQIEETEAKNLAKKKEAEAAKKAQPKPTDQLAR